MMHLCCINIQFLKPFAKRWILFVFFCYPRIPILLISENFLSIVIFNDCVRLELLNNIVNISIFSLSLHNNIFVIPKNLFNIIYYRSS